LITITIELKF